MLSTLYLARDCATRLRASAYKQCARVDPKANERSARIPKSGKRCRQAVAVLKEEAAPPEVAVGTCRKCSTAGDTCRYY
jgi:hypothetical protein